MPVDIEAWLWKICINCSSKKARHHESKKVNERRLRYFHAAHDDDIRDKSSLIKITGLRRDKPGWLQGAHD